MKNDLTHAKSLIKTCLETQATCLDLGNCGITDLNDLPELFECTHLETLILSSKWYSYENLKFLPSQNYGSKNKLQIIPLKISALKRLRTINLAGLGILNSSFLGPLISLQRLDISSNKIYDWYFLEKLISLQNLNLSFNSIFDGSFLKQINSLKDLNLSHNYISDWRFLENLYSLQYLNLSNNNISDVSFLESLNSLQNLNLSNNKITNGNFLEKLTSLEHIEISKNNIKNLPLNIFQTQMRVITEDYRYRDGLCLKGNPLESPPLEIIKQGKKAILDWFNANKKKLNEIKIILIGEPKAGKTSLLRRLKDDTFEENEVQTDGINIEDIDFGHSNSFKNQASLHKLTGHFWDFGGQEIINATHQFFLTNRSVYILVLS